MKVLDESIKSLQNLYIKWHIQKEEGCNWVMPPSFRRRAYDEGPVHIKQLSHTFPLLEKTPVCSVAPYTSLINQIAQHVTVFVYCPFLPLTFKAKIDHADLMIEFRLLTVLFLSLNLSDMKDLLSATGKCLRGNIYRLNENNLNH